MPFAWYGHLKFKSKPLVLAKLALAFWPVSGSMDKTFNSTL